MRLANRKRAKNTWSGGSYGIERTKLKISTMTSVETQGQLPASDRLHVERGSFGGLVLTKIVPNLTHQTPQEGK